MNNRRFRPRIFILFLLLTSFVAAACSTNESKSKNVIAEYLKGQGAADITVDFFYTNPDFPGKAYTSATVTYNFGSADGKRQREFLGFILARAGSGWRIEHPTGYTKEQQKAVTYLGGGK